jgi:alpha/beta superfamily hydrolase
VPDVPPGPPPSLHRVALTTLDGLSLDGDLARPASVWAAAVVAHPHPLYGGNRHSPVVDAVFHHLAASGVAAVRFDFRGVGESEGEHDGGVSERLDVAAALDLAVDVALHEASGAPVVLVGYSFGGRVTLDVLDERLAGWCAVAAPRLDGALAGPDHRPKHLLVPAHDQYAPPDVVAAATRGWTATMSVTIPSADHFLAGSLARVADEVLAAVSSLAGR